MLGGSILYVRTKFEANRSIHSKVIKGSQHFEIGSRDPSHGHSSKVNDMFINKNKTANIKGKN